MANTIIKDLDCVKFFVNLPQFDEEIPFDSEEQKEEAIKSLIYIESVKRAYSDMSRHTLKYSYEFTSDKNKEELTNQLKKKITKKIIESKLEEKMKTKMSADKFKDWHEESCAAITKVFTTTEESGWSDKPIDVSKTYTERKKEYNYCFTYGQAQKLLNMTIKYVYLFYRYYNCEKGYFEEEIECFNNNIGVLHVPIDSFVINELGKIDKDSRLFKDGKYKGVSWSKLDNELYFDLQDEIKNRMAENISSFVWELKNWPFKHYGLDDIQFLKVED